MQDDESGKKSINHINLGISASTSEELKEVCMLIQQVGELLLPLYYSQNFSVQQKKDLSYITEADTLAHHTLIQALKKISNNPIVSEESDFEESIDLSNDSEFWLIDPIDGTKHFINQSPHFCVCISKIKNTEPILGAIYAPVTKELFFAEKSKGAFNSKGPIAHANSCNYLRAVISGSQEPSKRLQKLFSLMNVQKFDQYGSALKFGHLAQGLYDIYPRRSATYEWDTAAGQVILSEAGASLIDLKTLDVMQYAKPNFLNSSFIAIANQYVPLFKSIFSEFQEAK